MLGAAACDRPQQAAAHPAVRDSAGIEIIESPQPLWRETDQWRLAAEPALRLGHGEDPAHQFAGIRSAVRLRDGGIVVADGGSEEIRIFDADGRHRNTAGGKGGGPGEFRSLRWVGLHGDSIVSYDSGGRRVSVFTGAGAFVRSVPLEETPELTLVQPMGVLHSGVLMVRPVMGSGLGFGTAERFDSVRFYGYDIATGDRVSEIGPFPGTESFMLAEGAPGRDGWQMGMSLPFGRALVADVNGDHLYIGTGHAPQIELYRHGRDLSAIIRWDSPVRPVTRNDIARFRAAFRGDGSSGPWSRRQERLLDAIPHPETAAPYSELRVDDEGRIWVAESRVGGDDPRWHVFDRQGRWLGRVSTPASLKIYRIGADWILGGTRDELDVEQVVLYRIERS